VNRQIKIISGGQTGADRAALDAALDKGATCGGWCPADRSAEDGVIADHYPLQPLPNGGGYDQRTRRNVADSHGTVIFCFGEPFGGTEKARRACIEMNKPLLIIDAAGDPPSAAMKVREFVERHAIRTLNVAGPRASEQPAVGAFVYRCIAALLAAS
jgi:hypothetical protein